MKCGGAANEGYVENPVRLNYLNVIVGSSLYITFGNKRRPAASAELKFSFSQPFLRRALPALSLFYRITFCSLTATSYMNAEERKQSEIAIAPARLNNWRAININGLISTGGRPVLAPD